MLATRPNGDMGKAAPRAARDPLRDPLHHCVCPFEFLRDGLTPFSPAASSSIKGAATFIYQLLNGASGLLTLGKPLRCPGEKESKQKSRLQRPGPLLSRTSSVSAGDGLAAGPSPAMRECLPSPNTDLCPATTRRHLGKVEKQAARINIRMRAEEGNQNTEKPGIIRTKNK